MARFAVGRSLLDAPVMRAGQRGCDEEERENRILAELEPLQLLPGLGHDAERVLQVVSFQMEKGQLDEAEDLSYRSGGRPLARPLLEQLTGALGVVREVPAGAGVEVRHRAPGTLGRMELTRPDRVDSHLPDSISRQSRPQDEQVGLEVGVIQRRLVECLARDRCPVRGQVSLAKRQIEVRCRERELSGARDLPVAEAVQPPAQLLAAALGQVGRDPRPDQLGGTLVIPGGGRVIDRLLEALMLRVPIAGAAMELGFELRLPAMELRGQASA